MLFFPRATRFLPIALGSAIGGSSMMMFAQQRQRLIFNDAAVQTRASKPRPGESYAKYAEPLNGKGITHFEGKVDYHQMTFGSFAGMVSGYFFGRISKLLVGFIVTSLMAAEYLADSGHIDLRPFYSKVYHWCRDHLNQEVFVDDASFKYSFSLAFIIAAYNA